MRILRSVCGHECSYWSYYVVPWCQYVLGTHSDLVTTLVQLSYQKKESL